VHLRSPLYAAVGALCLMFGACGSSDSVQGSPDGASAGGADPKELVFLFQKQRDPLEVRDAADKLSSFLSDTIGIPVRYEIPLQYSASVQALVSRTADIAYVSAIPYLLARRDGGAELLVVEERQDIAGVGRTDYDSVLVVKKDSDLSSFDDVVARAKDLRISFTSTQSTSGYVIPYRHFVQAGLLEAQQDPRGAFASIVFAGSYDAAVREVLAGRADVAAVSHYVVEGENAGNYLRPEELEDVRVLTRIPGVPTHLVCVRQGLSAELKQRIQEALLKVSEEAPDLLADVYGAKSLVLPRGEDHVAVAAEAVELLGIDVKGLVQ